VSWQLLIIYRQVKKYFWVIIYGSFYLKQKEAVSKVKLTLVKQNIILTP